MNEDLRTRQTIDRLLVAIQSRDLRAVQAALHPNATWQNLPHPAAKGRPAVMALLANILCWSDQVRWDVISSSVDGRVGWYERVDRFWLLGEEHAVAVGGAAVAGRVRDQGQVVPGGGRRVGLAGLQSLQYDEMRENDRYYRNAEDILYQFVSLIFFCHHQ